MANNCQRERNDKIDLSFMGNNFLTKVLFDKVFINKIKLINFLFLIKIK